MTARRFRGTAWALCAVVLAVPGAAAAGDDPHARHAQRLLTALQEVAGVPGLGAAVWKDGRLRWEGQAGLRDLDRRLPVQADTRFRLASVSKLFTATAAALLQERGQLDVDGPLTWHPFPGGHGGAAITPRQLAAHLSGLPHYELRDSHRGGSAFVDSRAAARHWLQGRALQSAPGEGYGYSSWGYTLLGAAIEAASGLPLQDYITRELTSGLDIGPDDTDSGDTRAARPYEEQGGRWRPAEPHDYSYSLGGAGLAATPGALASWGGRLLQGGVVKPTTLAWMTVPSRMADGREALHGTAQVGFGWRIELDAQSRPFWHHAGAALGARSALVVRPGPVSSSTALLSNAAWVASIVDSAFTLSEVFAPPAPGRSKLVCPRLARGASVAWQGQTLSAEVVSVQEDCAMLMRLPRSPKGWAARELRLLPLRPGNDLHEAALVTPIGLYVVRADGRGALRGRVAGQDWSMEFLTEQTGTGTDADPRQHTRGAWPS